MAYNCKIELNGNLGADPKVIDKNGKTFIALRVATKDSYPEKEGETTVWKDSKTTLWHDVLVFRPIAVEIAKKLEKGDRVEIIGSLSYRPFKDDQGFTKYQASIIGSFIQKVEFNSADEPTEEEISAASEEVPRS
ncbi:MAG: single-stranded DNA-binding protein [Saprospiraceae bacterium]|nr:single-stranded DNA-binding protein [Saprospiraceae bacterium]MCB9322946.1 single-stranded DNA-binding protein [Lewinellaceae bacterium]